MEDQAVEKVGIDLAGGDVSGFSQKRTSATRSIISKRNMVIGANNVQRWYERYRWPQGLVGLHHL